jgi:hypothetical protein
VKPEDMTMPETETINSRLIAAAPQMLQCLEKLLSIVRDREHDDATILAINAAESLIAQVRGDA